MRRNWGNFGLVIVALGASASAQSCPICITIAEAAKTTFIEGLRSGILILLFPPLMICLGFVLLVYKRRNSFDKNAEGENLVALPGIEPGFED